MRKCRCFICGAKDSDTNKARSSYIRAGIKRDEHGIVGDAKSKKHSRKIRRLRERLSWKKEEGL